MVAIETMSLKELFALRERLWADPTVVSAEIAASLGGPGAAKFMQGESFLLSSLVGLQQRVNLLESRVEALETQT